MEASESIIHSFGMYWQRDLVVWHNDAKMYGKQQAHSNPIDFGKQKGIHILYDHHTVVYVRRSIDRPLVSAFLNTLLIVWAAAGIGFRGLTCLT